MHIEINLNKSVDENAGIYFDKAKKGKKKIEGAKAIVEKYKQELEDLKGKELQFQEKEKQREEKKAQKQENQKWYSKFHNFISSEGLVCVGGRDATQNEILIKKHTEPNDLVLHTDMAGSPFFIIKDGQSEKCTETTIEECAQAVACYSRAWKEGHGTADVFYVKPEQVSKEAAAGEALSKGSFMVRGKTEYYHPNLEFAAAKIKNKEGGLELVLGPSLCISKQSQDLMIILPGREKKSVIAKKIRKEFGIGDIDEVVAKLPAGGAEIKKQRKRRK